MQYKTRAILLNQKYPGNQSWNTHTHTSKPCLKYENTTLKHTTFIYVPIAITWL